MRNGSRTGQDSRMDSYERKEVLGLEGSNEQMNHLVRKAIRGNAEAYGQLIEHYKEYLYKTAFCS